MVGSGVGQSYRTGFTEPGSNSAVGMSVLRCENHNVVLDAASSITKPAYDSRQSSSMTGELALSKIVGPDAVRDLCQGRDAPTLIKSQKKRRGVRGLLVS